MDYDTLGPGREMDALVAEKVMGWPLQSSAPYTWPHVTLNVDPTHDCLWLFRMADKGTHYTQEHWSPSTSISAAWEVVEKFDSFSIVHNAFYKKLGEEFIVCELTKYEPEAYAEARANTAPLAICRAALKSAGEKEGG
jgi:hypothetical protein